MIAAFGARELDLHKNLTGESVLKLSFYLRDVPVPQKLLASVVVAGFGCALLFLLLRHSRPVLSAFRRLDPFAVTVVLFVATLVLSKILDRSVNLFVQDLGIPVPPRTRLLVQGMEELLELTLPLLLLNAIVQRRRLAGRTGKSACASPSVASKLQPPR